MIVGVVVVVLVIAGGGAAVLLLGGDDSSDDPTGPTSIAMYPGGLPLARYDVGTTTPAETWRSDADFPDRVAITTDGEHPIVLTRSEDGDAGRVIAFDAATGDERWSRDVEGVPYWLTPIGDAALVAMFDDSDSSGEAGLGSVSALDRSSGALLWEVSLDEYPSVYLEHEGVVTVTSESVDGDARLLGLDADDGTEVWSVDVEDHALWEDTAAVTADGELSLIGLADGETRWTTAVEQVEFAGNDDAPVAVNEETVVVTTPDGVALGFSAASGELIWETDADSDDPSAVGAEVTWIQESGEGVAVGADGDEAWDAPGSLLLARPDTGMAYVEDDEDLVVFDVSTGVERARRSTSVGYSPGGELPVVQSFATDGILGLDDLTLILLDPDTLDELWSVEIDDGFSDVTAVAGGVAYLDADHHLVFLAT